MSIVSEIVVVSPHLDDAVLSAYAMLGPSTTVVTVFAGLPPDGVLSDWDAGSGALDSRTRIEERRAEDRRALERSGAAFVHLDLGDRQYVALGSMPANTETSVAAELRGHIGGAPLVLAPSALSSSSRNPIKRHRRRRNSDHRLVREAVLAVRPDAALYADLPYALTADRGFVLPSDLDRRHRREHRVQLDPELLADKLESVRCYTTQIPPLAEVFGDFLRPEALGLEVWWSADAAAPSATVGAGIKR